MKKLIQALFSIGAFGAATLVAQAQSAPKIYVVDMTKLFDTHYETQSKKAELADASTKAKAQIDEMNKEGDALVAQYKDYDEQAKNATATPEAKATAAAAAQKKGAEIQQKMQDVQTFANNANQMIQQRIQAFRASMLEKISKDVVIVAKLHDASLVLDKSGPSALGISPILYSDPSYDLTDEVAAEIAKNKPAGPMVPPPAATAPAAPTSSDTPQITVPGVTPAK